MTALHVGFDTGPLLGPKTGIGLAVQALRDELSGRSDVELVEYVLSARARSRPGLHKLPLPAALAHRCWARSDMPRLDHWLGDAAVLHGTNYVVPPSRLPRVVSVYDCWFLRHPDQASAAVRRAGQVLTRAVASGAVVHASSHATEAAVRELLPGAAVRIVHLGALPLTAPPQSPPVALDGNPFILAIGTLERRKNLPRLVQAFGMLSADHPDLQLVLAGSDGDDSAAVRAAVDALGPGFAHRVAFTGRADEHVRSWLLHHADVLAYPSLDEGFGFPLLEAMQAGVPVVASNAGSIPEVAGEAALLSDPTDVEALAANLSLALTSQSVRAHLVATGSTRWPMYSWQRCAEQMVALYRDVEQAGSAGGVG